MCLGLYLEQVREDSCYTVTEKQYYITVQHHILIFYKSNRKSLLMDQQYMLDGTYGEPELFMNMIS